MQKSTIVSKVIKVIQVTSVHPRYDTRIFYKNCVSLAKTGLEVTLIVADGLGNEKRCGVNIIDCGVRSTSRIGRMTKTVFEIYKTLNQISGDIYHLHDPELITLGMALKANKKKVIIDIHENVSLQILDKDYLPKYARKAISVLYRIFEKNSLKRFDALILAEQSYLEYYERYNEKCIVVLNMPDIEVLTDYVVSSRGDNDTNEIFYLGGVSKDRGLDTIISALNILHHEKIEFIAHFVGPYSVDEIKDIVSTDLNKKVKFYGYMDMLEGYKLSNTSKIGISLVKPIKNYKTSYSTKIFEYMAIELPVITSNFELYKEIVEKENCGICVDPLNPRELSEAIKTIFRNKELANIMGANGRKVAVERYNWAIQENVLLSLYSELLELH